MLNKFFNFFKSTTYTIKKNVILGLIIAALALGIKFLHIKVGLDMDKDGHPDIAINISNEDGARLSIEGENDNYKRRYTVKQNSSYY